MKALAACLLILVMFDVSAQTKKPAQKPVQKKPVPAKAQPEIVEGFWLVTKVTIGTKEHTPVARWFKMEKGKQVSGNGWTQHSFGTYKYDKKKAELLVNTTNEPEDEYGVFKVERTGPFMTWTRKEEGEMVVVELKIVTELPMSPGDMVKGVWILSSATNYDQDILKTYDPDRKHFLFIRWDHQFTRQINAHERVNGYWFFDAYLPEMKLISENLEREDEVWTVSFDAQKMTLKGASSNVLGMVLGYRRTSEIP